MLFSSFVFLFLFLPLVLLCNYLVKSIKLKNFILLVFSLIFYSWGEPIYILLMLFSVLFNYYFALIMDKKVGNSKKGLLIIILFFNLFLLGFFKYCNFFIDNLNLIFPFTIKTIEISLPIGISFYTFQILSYIIDVYRNKVKVQKNLINLALYISLFPQLVAGPIVRYETIEKELQNRKENFNKFMQGLKRFIIGFSKKIIIANNAAIIADTIYNNNLFETGTSILWLAAISYTIQIYYDFSGYSDMAIGLGKMFGFTFLENFNYPYISKSITEFWRKWHISLSSWFRDYLYIPLGGNRVDKFKWIRNIFIVWFLTGMWHGASWNFILWGLYYFIILLIEKLGLLKFLDKTKIISRIYTILLFIIGWVIFRLENFDEMIYVLKTIFVYKQDNLSNFLAFNSEIMVSLPFVFLGIIGSIPIYKIIKNKFENNIVYFALESAFLFLIFTLSLLFLLGSTYNPFIYFKF